MRGVIRGDWARTGPQERFEWQKEYLIVERLLTGEWRIRSGGCVVGNETNLEDAILFAESHHLARIENKIRDREDQIADLVKVRNKLLGIEAWRNKLLGIEA